MILVPISRMFAQTIKFDKLCRLIGKEIWEQ